VIRLLALLALLAAPAAAQPTEGFHGEGPTAAELDALPTPDTPPEAIELARQLAAIEEYPDASAVLDTALRRWPGHHDLLVMLGLVKLWSKDYGQSIRAFTLALDVAADSADAQDGLFLATASSGEYEAAEQIIENLRGQRPPADLASMEVRLLQLRGAHWKAWRAAKAAEAEHGPTPTTNRVLSGLRGISIRPHTYLETRANGPLVGWGAEARFQPHQYLRFWGFYDGSTWLNDVEHRFGGGVLVRSKVGFTAMLGAGAGIPGIRVPRLDLQAGFGYRTPRELEPEIGYAARLYGANTWIHLLRGGITLPLRPKTKLAVFGFLAFVDFPGPGAPQLGPGAYIGLNHVITRGLSMNIAYANGTELFLNPVSGRVARFFTQRALASATVDLTDRVGLTVQYSFELWSTNQPFHRAMLQPEFRF
jgi:hypothetical protein